MVKNLYNLTIVIPFYNGQATLDKLIDSIPQEIPIIIVDDVSEDFLYPPVKPGWDITTMRSERKRYFTGSVNRGIEACDTDVLVLNQDTWFESVQWLTMLERERDQYAMIGERIHGTHPAFGNFGYIHGTFMFLRRDALDRVGLLNERDYPLWGSTAEYQWRVARNNFKILPLEKVPGFVHERPATERFGSSIKNLLEKEPKNESWFIRTPPLLSVIVPCYNYGRYLPDCISSLVGGNTSLGEMPGQTFQSFEVIIVDDASTDNSMEFIEKVVDQAKGIRAYHLQKNVGTAQALNFGIQRAVGKYITFLSADDMRESDSLEKLVRACEENPHSFVYDDVWIVNEHGRVKKWQIEDYDFEKLIWKNQVHAGIMFPKEAWIEVGGYPAAMGDGREDWAFNIALGIYGWCGVRVKNFGYLYRREGQNRTEYNTTETHREHFLAKIMDIFPEIYKGYRPMACCGKGGNSRKNVGINSTLVTRSSSVENSLIGAQGMVKIEYLGEQMMFTISGDVTNAKYSFGKDRPRGWVAQQDIGSRESKTGFLSKRDRSTGKWLYREVETANKSESIQKPVQVVEINSNSVAQVGGSLTAVEQILEPVPVQTLESVQEVIQKYPNPTNLNVEEIKALKLTKEQWVEVYKAEMANRNRKGAVLFMEELLANWADE